MDDWQLETLDAARDHDRALALARRAADYVRLDTGRDPDAAYITEFFEDLPPGGNASDLMTLGIVTDDTLAGLLGMARGYETESDWWIGLLLLDPKYRGRRLGAAVLAEIRRRARAEGIAALKLAVLRTNPRGLAFWQAHGFVHHRDAPDHDDPSQDRVVLKHELKGG
ncbi:GNAT family N-acetyltransferase [Sulfitobacter sp. D35]|uniref:GNAT family N-acetyltransferase n=1 Tax=Sulfitobacter sp. D35 TaxID=3083252 RepID=UPI00296E85DA|nr:GNAT family N-acetyltransferase [Sulfitobacter sp. D35]MDW4499257.1 GNAT family N-acetyltransferase [Sulfitobacter sp. D35]